MPNRDYRVRGRRQSWGKSAIALRVLRRRQWQAWRDAMRLDERLGPAPVSEREAGGSAAEKG